jgi:5-methylcytosine-specific restriction endonuclease McrA
MPHERKRRYKKWMDSPKAEREKILNKQRKAKNEFSSTPEWIALRDRVLRKYGRRCMKCGTDEEPIQVDHIKSRAKYPELKLKFKNCQVLCGFCNNEKGSDDDTDYR